MKPLEQVISPLDMQVLNLYPMDYPFDTLVDRVRKNKLILNPDFQRKYKWDKDGNEERASRFIESCLMRIPIPACYFAEDDYSNHEVIDGVQRITTIQRFFNNEFPLEGLSIYPELNGKKFDELSSRLRNEIENTTMRCIVLRKENPRELVHEIFARLNQGAVKLSDQEIRHAIYPGKFDDLLVELGEHKVLRTFQNKGEKKQDRTNEELVLRFFALDNDLKDYDGQLSKLLDKFMAKHQHADSSQIEIWRNSFSKSLDRCLRTFENPFTNPVVDKSRQGILYYDLLMWSFSQESDDFIDNNKTLLQEKFEELCGMEEFKKKASGGTQQKAAILKRRELWRKKIDEIHENY